MDTTLLELLMILVILLLGGLLAVLYMQLRKLQDSSDDSVDAVQYLVQTIHQSQMQLAALGETLGQIEPVTAAGNKAEIQLRSLTERVAAMEQSQTMAHQGLVYLSNSLIHTDSSIKSEYNKGQQQLINTLYQIGTRLDAQISKVEQETSSSFAELTTLTNSLSEAISSTRSELARAKTDLAEIHSSMTARIEIEQRTVDAIRRLEAISAGTQSQGLAGEDILKSDQRSTEGVWLYANSDGSALPMLRDTQSDAQAGDLTLALTALRLDSDVTQG